MKSLALTCGVPDWKVKIQAGVVKGGGHAYCTYIRDDDTQCILDWCYWPNKLPINARPKFKDESNYHNIWFSFNKNHAYAETKIAYGQGEVSFSAIALEIPEEPIVLFIPDPEPVYKSKGNKIIKTMAEIHAGISKKIT